MPAPTIADEAAARLLELIRDGCPDAEIAVRLGSPIADVKARVERLMSRAGVETRSGLVAWSIDAAPAAAITAITGAPALLARSPVAPRGPRRRLPVGRVLSIVAAVLAPVTLVAIFVLWPAGRGDQITVRPFSLPDVAPSPVVGQPPAGRALREVPPGPFPHGLVLYVLTGCATCDVPPTGVDRLWRDAAGTLHTETLFPAPADPAHYISTVWASPDGAQMAVGVCVQGRCGQRTRPGHPERPSPDARVQIWRSTTGGVTWEDAGTVGGSVRIFDQVTYDRAPSELVLQICTRTAGAIGCAMRLFPSLSAAVPHPERYLETPILAREGVLRWEKGGTFPEDVPGWSSPERSYNFSILAPLRWGMATYEPGVDGLVDTKLSLIDGETAKLVDQVVVSATTVSFGAWFRGPTAVVLVEQSPGLGRARTAAVVDVASGTYQAIAEPFTTGAYAGTLMRVLAARPGPVAVAFEAGPCLPVMPVPGPVVPNGCLVQGEMVTVQNAAPYEGVHWLGVRMDNGIYGLLPENEPRLRHVGPWQSPGVPWRP